MLGIMLFCKIAVLAAGDPQNSCLFVFSDLCHLEVCTNDNPACSERHEAGFSLRSVFFLHFI